MIRSLRARLTIGVLLVLAAILAGFALVLHVALVHALRRQLDARLSTNAAAVAGMAEDGVPPEFEYESLPEFERPIRPGFFEAWLDDGRVLARSPSLGVRDLSRLPGRAGGSIFSDVTLPDGRPGRAIELRQPLRIEDAPPGGPASDRFVTVLVAQGTEEVTEAAAAMSRWLCLLALLALAAGSVATAASVTRGLRPVRDLATEIGRRDQNDLARALPTDLPGELRPVVDKLAELFSRLSESFERERRFTADVSHELRTPLAALRTILEVAGSRDRDAASYRLALGEATSVVAQAQALVQNLLTLARLDARQVEIENRDVPLRQFVGDCWRMFAAQAARRRLTFSNDIGPSATMATDPGKLRIVMTNLLANAAEYTAEGGAIHVREGRDGVLIEVVDSGPPLAEDLLPQVFERFARGDRARSGGVHSGVGLALVRAICEVLGLSVAAVNDDDGSVRFTLRRRPGSRGQEPRGSESRSAAGP